MSIAELIMTGSAGTERSTAGIGDSLAKLGQQVGATLAAQEYQKQAAETLPALQASMQQSLSLAQQGKSGEAYSNMLGTITPQMMNNPQLLPFLKLGIDAIGKSSDDYTNSLRASKGTTPGIADLIAAKALGIPLTTPTTPSPLGGEQQEPAPLPEPSNQTGQGEYQGVDMTDLSPTKSSVYSVSVPMTDGTTMYAKVIEAPLPTQAPAPSAGTQPTDDDMEKLINAADQYRNVGKKLQSESPAEILSGNAITTLTPNLTQILNEKFNKVDIRDGSKFGIEAVFMPKDPLKDIAITLKGNQSSINIKDKDVTPFIQNRRASFPIDLTNAIARLNDSNEIQQLFEAYGSINNIPKSIAISKGGKEVGVKYPLPPDKNGTVKYVSLYSGQDEKTPGLADALKLVLNAPNAGQTLGIPVYIPKKPAVDVKSYEGKIGTDPVTGKQFKIVNGQPIPLK